VINKVTLLTCTLLHVSSLQTQPHHQNVGVCRNMTGIQIFDISSTNISGKVPDGIQTLHYLKLFSAGNTRMFCCDDVARCQARGDPGCLPDFLQFEDALSSTTGTYDYSSTWVESNAFG
jgi:hypothetical protein